MQTQVLNRDVTAGDLVKGAIAGLAGGLAGTWVMTQVQSLLSPKPDETEKQQEAKHSSEPSKEQPSPTVLLADRLSRTFRGRPISDDMKPAAGMWVHYSYGTLMGGTYGILSEVFPPIGRGAGLPWGVALWAGGDEIALPLLKLSAPPNQYPASVHLSALAFHLAYGLATYALCTGVRELLDREFPARPRQIAPERGPEVELRYEEFVATGI